VLTGSPYGRRMGFCPSSHNAEELDGRIGIMTSEHVLRVLSSAAGVVITILGGIAPPLWVTEESPELKKVVEGGKAERRLQSKRP
jgi:hypothetical protein